MNELFNNWTFVTYTPDIILLGKMILISLGLLFLGQRTGLGAILLAIYPAWLITALTPSEFLTKPSTKVIFFLGLVLLLYYSLLRPLARVSLGGQGLTRWLRRFFLAFLTSGLLLSLLFSWLPEKTIDSWLTELGRQIFLIPLARLGWAVAPLLFLTFFRRD